jgi:site-specific DNA-methyltransferase (adenine-specific)
LIILDEDLTKIYNMDIVDYWRNSNNQGTIDLVVTSPPYNLDMNYQDYEDWVPFHNYEKQVENWAICLYGLLKPNGRVCINVPLDTNKGGKHAIYAMFVDKFTNFGFKYQCTIVWNEQNISRRTAWGSFMSPSAPFVTAPVEMIIVFYKGEWRRGKAGTTDITREEFIDWTLGIWTFSGEKPKRVGHPAPFPEELPRRLIKLYSFKEDTILDPFLGSGTTCAVAKQLGRKSIGIDIDDSYCNIAAERVRNV